MAKTKAVRNTANNAEKYLKNKQGMPILGEIISWSKRGSQHLYQDVLKALRTAKLPEDLAKKILPAQAWQRAYRKLEDDGIIHPLNKVGDVHTFQLTEKKLLEKGGVREWKFNKKTEITLNVATGAISCPEQDIQKFAQAELDKAIETRTSGDITGLLKSVFESADADLGIINLGESGGCYLVPAEYTHFCNNVQSFLVELGRSLTRFPIAAGDKQAETAMSETVADHMATLIKEMEKKVEDFTITTRLDTLSKQAEEIKDLRVKIHACAHYLKEKVADTMSMVDALDEVLVNKCSALAQERKDAPPRSTLANGVGIIGMIEKKLREATPKRPVTEQEILETLVAMFPEGSPEYRPVKGMRHTISVQLRYPEYSSLWKKGLVIMKTNNGYYLEK